MSPPGTVVASGTRVCVVLDAQGALCVVAPIVPRRPPHYAGDVPIDERYVVRAASAALASTRGWKPIGDLPSEIVAECQRWARRCTLTARIVAQAAPLAAWHRDAANERSAVS